MSSSVKLKNEVDYIVQILQTLEYSEVECVEASWVHQLLFTPFQAREQLLMWTLSQLGAADLLAALDEQNISAKHTLTDTAKAVQVLSSLGLCRDTDHDLVSGNAPPLQQSRFWRLLLESVVSIRAVRSQSNDALMYQHHGDQMLHTLCSSAALQQMNKGEGVSLLPGDLQDKYRVWSRQQKHQQQDQESVADMVADTQRQLQQVRDQYQLIPHEFKNIPKSQDYESTEAAVISRLNKLNQTGRVFEQVHNSHLAVWLKKAEADDRLERLPDTGKAVHEAYEALNKLNKVLSSTSQLTEKTEQLRAAEASILQSMYEPNTVATTVKTLATLT